MGTNTQAGLIADQNNPARQGNLRQSSNASRLTRKALSDPSHSSRLVSHNVRHPPQNNAPPPLPAAAPLPKQRLFDPSPNWGLAGGAWCSAIPGAHFTRPAPLNW